MHEMLIIFQGGWGTLHRGAAPEPSWRWKSTKAALFLDMKKDQGQAE